MNATRTALLLGCIWLSVAALPGGAQNQTPLADPGAAATPNPATLPPLAPESPAAVDRAFLIAAAQGTNAELDMANLAVTHGHADEVLGFAEIMLTDHAALERRFADVTRTMGAPAAPRENEVDRLALVRLAHAKAADFDQQYLVQQVGDHLATISLFTSESKEGADPSLRRFAASELSMLRSHLQLAVADTSRIGGDTPFSSH